MLICHNYFVIIMKKKILIIALIILCSGCSFFNKKEESQKENKDNEVIEEVVEEEPKYVDDNPIKIGLYDRNGNTIKLLKEYSSKIEPKKDIEYFQAFPSNEELITYSGMKYPEFYYQKWNEVNQDRKYKIGFNLKYTLNDGKQISQNIFGPSTTQTNYDYIEVYLYDSYTHRNDSFYIHIEEKDTEKEYYITSIKLTAGSKFNDIKSKIKLTVFTYDEDDFDELGEYRGVSKYSILVSNLNKTYEETNE